MKEYSLDDLLYFSVGTEFEETIHKDIVVISSRKSNKYITIKELNEPLAFSVYWKTKKFKKYQKPVDFLEAWRSYQEGKIIQSLETKNRYIRHYTGSMVNIDEQERWKCDAIGIGYKELEGEWYVQERSN